MRLISFLILLISFIGIDLGLAQNIVDFAPNSVSKAQPYGKVNATSYPQLKDYELLIGTCDCKSTVRLPDGSWADTLKTIWRFKYVLDGNAVQDENWRENGTSTSTYRTFNPDSSKWSATFFSSVGQPINPRVWTGGTVDGDIVLITDQPAPNGFAGDSRLTFYEISEDGFKWKGEWVSKNGSTVVPFSYITCKKRKE